MEKLKDLCLLGWVFEVWLNLYGFEGIVKVLEFMYWMLNEYWI